MIFAYVALASAAGAVVFGILLILSALKDGKVLIPLALTLVCALVFGVSVIMMGSGDGDKGGKEPGSQSEVDTSTADKSEDDTKDEPDQSKEPSSDTKKPDKDTFGVGEEVDFKDIIVTMNSVTESEGEQFFTPDDGNVYVICEFTIENNSKKDLNISSVMCFDAYVDDYSTSMSITAQSASSKNQLDGTVASGKKMNGIIGYEVPEDWKEIEIRFTPDFWGGKDIIFTYSK